MKRFVSSFIGAARAACAHPVARVFHAALIGGVSAWLAVMLWGEASGDLGLMIVRASLKPVLAGKTVVEVPPFGSVSAFTHTSPVRLSLQVEQVRIERAIRWLRDKRSREDTTALVRGEMEELVRHLVWRTFFAALIGATVSSVLLVVGWHYKPVGVLAGLIAVAAPVALVTRTYSLDAFRNPGFQGEISRAPYLLDTAQQIWRRYSTAVDLVPRVSERVEGLYRELERGPLARPGDERRYIRALIISDLHNNPIALSFALSLSRSYDVDLVLAPGDVTDFGSPLETELLEAWREFKAPVVAVTGNHDSPQVAQALESVTDVSVLEKGEVVERAGIRVMGFGDPAAARGGLGEARATPGELAKLTQVIKRHLARTKAPDVFMVHNFRVAAGVAGNAPFIVTGHSHGAGIRRLKGSVIVNPGTTGAAGVRYLSEPKQPAYTAAVLHFDPDGDKPEPRMVDIVTMRQPSGDFAISRVNLGDTDGKRADGGPSESP